MGKLIDKGWKKDSDPFYREGWTLSVSLGLKEPSEKKSRKGPDPIALKAAPKKPQRKGK